MLLPVSILTCRSSSASYFAHRYTKFRLNRTISGVLMTSLKFSRWRQLTSRINFRFQFDSADVVRRSGSPGIPNLVKTHQHRTFAETRCQNTDTTHIKYQDAEMQISRNQQATSSVYHTELYRTIIKQEGQHPLTGIGTPNFM